MVDLFVHHMEDGKVLAQTLSIFDESEAVEVLNEATHHLVGW